MSVWPEPFVEALAFQVAIDASLNDGRLAAAQALYNIFQVLSLTHKHMLCVLYIWGRRKYMDGVFGDVLMIIMGFNIEYMKCLCH